MALVGLTYVQNHSFILQYFLNPKVAKEPVPPQLELISKEVLVPLLAVFHQFVEKVLCFSYLPCSPFLMNFTSE